MSAADVGVAIFGVLVLAYVAFDVLRIQDRLRRHDEEQDAEELAEEHARPHGNVVAMRGRRR